MNLRDKLARTLEIGVVICAVVVATLLVQREILPTPAPLDVASAIPIQGDPGEFKVTRQIVFVYVGDLNCPFCTSDEFGRTLVSIKRALREQVEARGDQLFYAVGVLISADADGGLRYLNDRGPWSELSIGGGWGNAFVQEHVVDRGGNMIVPQVIVFGRDLVQGGGLFVTNQSRLKRIEGASTLKHVLDNQQWWRLLPDSVTPTSDSIAS